MKSEKRNKKVSATDSNTSVKVSQTSTKVKEELGSLHESVKSFKAKESFSAFWADYKAVRSK